MTSQTSIQTLTITKGARPKLLQGRSLSSRGLRYVALIAFVLVSLAGTRAAKGQSTFLGLKIGMDSDRALRALKKPDDILNSLPYISGKKILNDTAQLTFCKLDFRRSFGFDSTGHLAVVGLTHKTSIPLMTNERDCAMQWLVNQFGAPIGENRSDDVRVTFWNVSGAKLTLEAKAYNEHDAFVLIYLYSEVH